MRAVRVVWDSAESFFASESRSSGICIVVLIHQNIYYYHIDVNLSSNPSPTRLQGLEKGIAGGTHNPAVIQILG
jgi:hypothetical protein